MLSRRRQKEGRKEGYEGGGLVELKLRQKATAMWLPRPLALAPSWLIYSYAEHSLATWQKEQNSYNCEKKRKEG